MEWIPVTACLPEIEDTHSSKDVLIYTKSGITIGFFAYSLNKWVDYCDEIYENGENGVTHWMPAPNKPGEPKTVVYWSNEKL